MTRVPGTYRNMLRRGNVLAVLPEIADDAPEDLKNALAIRNAASMTGRCACGAVAGAPKRGAPGIFSVTFEHKPDCPAGNENLERILGASS